MSEHKYIPGYGPMGARLMILGECPTPEDTTTGKLFCKSGTLNSLLNDAGINRQECWMTSVSKYWVPPSPGKKKIPFAVRAKQHGIDINQQLSDLQEEINAIKPNTIMAVGRSALWALSGKIDIESYRGSIMHGMGTKFVPTFNPDHLNWNASSDIEFRGYWNRQIILVDMKRAKKQSSFRELILPSRNLQIARNSYQLYEFIQMYKDRIRLAVDIEANGTCIPVCIGLAFNKHHGLTVPLWNTQGISTIPTSDLIQMWIMLADLLMRCEIVGQNFNYDRDKIRRLGFTIRKLVSDTMLKAHAINPELPKGLAFNTSLFTEEPFYKNEGMYQGSISDLLLGCARDACVTFEVDEAMDIDLDEIQQRSFFENFLMKLPEFYLSIENQGFRVNHEERDRLLRKYIEWDERVRYELFQITGTEINVNSHVQVGTLLWENFKLPRRQGTGEEEITALLNNKTSIKKPEHRRACELILEGRRVRKSISTYLMAMPDFDGRMRTTYFPCLDTGRTSTSQQSPPIRPTIEVVDENGKKKNKELGIAFQTMTKHGDIGADIRGMYVPDNAHFEVITNAFGVHSLELVEEEEVFVQADSSQAEARVVWLLADDEEALRLVDEIDYHAWTASWFFGGTESDYSKKVLGFEHPIRFAGKTLRHAGHLGAGKRRAAIEVNTQARKYKIYTNKEQRILLQITEDVSERALTIFHAKQPKIQRVFQAGVVECLKKDRVLIAPIPYGIDASFGGRRMFFERWGDELNRQAFSYIPQRAVSDNTKAAGLRIVARIPRIKIVMESHDALLFSVPKSKVPLWTPIIKQEFERPIDFSKCSISRRSLVIPCEIETGSNYKELSKFRDFVPVPNDLLQQKRLPRNITEAFFADTLPADSPLTNIIYEHQMRKNNNV